MPGSLLAFALQVGPFWQQRPADDFYALRPVAAVEERTVDVLWPLFTSHDGWWRFAFLAYWHSRPEDDSYQFSLLPFWFNGRDSSGQTYAGFFPVAGYHPHIATLYDAEFALWPLWHSYKKPRGRDWLVTHSVLFPFFSWRSDGSWGAWPLYGVNHARESDRRYALWPLATWASYRQDRDTAGEGWSWMFWPLYGQVRRERESQDLFLPPLFSYAEVRRRGWEGEPGVRIRCPWPFFELESSPQRERISVWPFYEKVTDNAYDRRDGREIASTVTRFGWKLVELYDDETRVFPFWASRKDGSYLRVWPFWESAVDGGGIRRSRFLSLFPVRWVPAIDRNWSKFWTFYECESYPLGADHSLFWGIVRWHTERSEGK